MRVTSICKVWTAGAQVDIGAERAADDLIRGDLAHVKLGQSRVRPGSA